MTVFKTIFLVFHTISYDSSITAYIPTMTYYFQVTSITFPRAMYTSCITAVVAKQLCNSASITLMVSYMLCLAVAPSVIQQAKSCHPSVSPSVSLKRTLKRISCFCCFFWHISQLLVGSLLTAAVAFDYFSLHVHVICPLQLDPSAI